MNIYEYLKNLNIEFIKHSHPPVFTCEEAKLYCDNLPWAKIKNLFLRNKKKDKYYLIIISDEKKVNIKQLEELLFENKMSFASAQDLMDMLWVNPGSVSPLALINNKENDVKVIIDKDIMNHEFVIAHPNTNDASLQIKIQYFIKFLDNCWNEYQIMELPFN